MAAFIGAGLATPAVAACDRQCLLHLTDRYVLALARHDPRGLPISAHLVFVENATRMRLGEGLWKTTTGGPTRFSVHVPDPQNQTAGWIGMISDKGEPAIVAIRLKLAGGRIVEAEHLVSPVRKENLKELQSPRPGLLADVPPARRLPHDQLIRIGASYYDALDDNDGTKALVENAWYGGCKRRPALIEEDSGVLAQLGTSIVAKEAGARRKLMAMRL